MALGAAEATLVPHAILRDHLLGSVHGVAATRAPVPVAPLLPDLRLCIDAEKKRFGHVKVEEERKLNRHDFDSLLFFLFLFFFLRFILWQPKF